jgi:hypothetical protein
MVGSVIVFIFAPVCTVGFVIAFRVTYFLVAGVWLAATATWSLATFLFLFYHAAHSNLRPETDIESRKRGLAMRK